jgi:hypothetical protein
VIEVPARSALGNLLPFNRKEWSWLSRSFTSPPTTGAGSSRCTKLATRPREVNAMMFAYHEWGRCPGT